MLRYRQIQVGTHFKDLDEGVLTVPSDVSYTQIGFELGYHLFKCVSQFVNHTVVPVCGPAAAPVHVADAAVCVGLGKVVVAQGWVEVQDARLRGQAVVGEGGPVEVAPAGLPAAATEGQEAEAAPVDSIVLTALVGEAVAHFSNWVQFGSATVRSVSIRLQELESGLVRITLVFWSCRWLVPLIQGSERKNELSLLHLCHIVQMAMLGW